jgi:hypothetical protein
VVAPLIAGCVTAIAWLSGWRGVDVPAQVYRVDLFRRYGWILWDSRWYGGHYALPYSVLFPPLGAAIGLYGAAALSAVVAAWAFERLVQVLGARSLRAAGIFAIGLFVPVAIGQFPFLAGEAVGLLAVLAARAQRRVIAVVLTVACALFSPVAGAFLVLVFASWAIASPGRRVGLVGLTALAGSPLVVLGVAFPDPGRYPFWGSELVAILVICVVALAVVPARLRVLRVGLAVYGATAVVVFLVPNPLGGVLGRLAEGFSPAVAVAISTIDRRRFLALLALPLLVWQGSGVAGAIHAGQADPSSHASYYAPLLRFFARQPTIGRVEIPFTRDHWEVDFVAPHVPIARGWERQLDIAYNPIFYADHLSSSSYHRWLKSVGVTWVAVSDAPLDYSARAEARLVSNGLRFLQPVWHNSHWRVWRVVGSPGLTSGSSRLVTLQPDRFVLDAAAPGTTTIRIRYTPAWTLVQGRGCVRAAPDQWTQVVAFAPGRITIDASVTPDHDDCDRDP